jgi:CMP-N-acetylneuraminic acid synthetase
MSQKFNVAALLPMKAHSSRVPNKNFKSFHGKPLFMWMLDTLLSVDAIDVVVINTDARELLASHGVETSPRVLVRDRREEICGDDVSMNLVIADDIQSVKARTYLMTHTTNPLLGKTTLVNALDKFEWAVDNNSADSLFSVNRFQSRFYTEAGSAINHDPDNLIPTQNLPIWYEENSCLYVFTQSSFERTKARIGKRPYLFETPRPESVDIDTPEDWDFALAMGNYLRHNEASK